MGAGNQYHPVLNSRVNKINSVIKRNFSDVVFCSWSSELLNEFAQHLSSYHFILVDVERDVAESVYYSLKESFSGVFLRPSSTLINDVLPDFRQPIIIRHLATESPLNEHGQYQIVSLEKILVDIFCDMEFDFLEGSERRAIFQNAYYKYTINENKLIRYAARKGKKPELSKYILNGEFAKQNRKTITTK